MIKIETVSTQLTQEMESLMIVLISTVKVLATAMVVLTWMAMDGQI